jgi:hypothetical protein
MAANLSKAKKIEKIEDYEPGATKAEFLEALRMVAQVKIKRAPKKSDEKPVQA